MKTIGFQRGARRRTILRIRAIGSVLTALGLAIGALPHVALATGMPSCASSAGATPCLFQNFEMDGNKAQDLPTAIDWNSNPFPYPRTNFIDLPTGNSDDGFKQGSKWLDQSGWVCTGHKSDPKDDLIDGSVAFANLSVGGSTHQVGYFQFSRVSGHGDTFVDFAFSKGAPPAGPGCAPLPMRQTGDIVVTFVFTNGGGVDIVDAARWNGATSKFDALATGSMGANFVAAFNSTGTYGEGALDMTATGVGPFTCHDLGTVYMDTHASGQNSVNEMKDFVSPAILPLCSQATLATQSSPTGGNVPPGTSASDSAVVTGNAAAGAPTGSVNFFLCGPADSNPSTGCPTGGTALGGVTASTPGTDSSGNPTQTYSSPASAATTVDGLYCWRAEYTSGLTTEYNNIATAHTNNSSECFTVKTPPPPVGTLTAVIYNCASGSPTTTVEPGGISYSGPASGSTTVPPALSASVAPGAYTVNATAGAGFELVACTSTAGVSTQSVTVPSDGTGNAVFYEQLLAPAMGTLNAAIFLCDGGVMSTTPEPGSISASGPTSIASTTVPPAISQTVHVGDYVVNATAGAHFHLVACGAPAGQTSTKSTTVTSDTPGTANFYEVPNNGTLGAVIYNCASGSPTTTVEPGGISYSGPASGSTTVPPALSASVAPGAYTVNATAGAGFELVACTSTAGVSTQSVTVPSDGTGNAVFYEQLLAPAMGTLNAAIFLCDGGVMSTTPEPGSISASGPTSIASTTVPPAISQTVHVGDYVVNATAGAHFHLVACGAPAGQTSTKSTTVTSDTPGTANFYEVPNNGTLGAVIYNCASGSPTTTVEPGGISYSGPASGSTTVPPALSASVAPGAYTVNATAGAGFELVACTSTAGVSTQSVRVPSDGTGNAVFYEQAIPAPPDCDGDHDSSNAATDVDCHNPPALDCDGDHDNSQSVTGEPATCQNPAGTPDCDGDSDNTPAASCPPGTLVATVYLCDANGSPTTTVEPGTFSVTPGTTLTEGIPASVTAGSYVVTATAGSGFALAACHGPTGPQTAVVPSGGTVTLAFYESRLSSGTLAASVSQPNTGVGGNAPLTLAAAALLIGFGILLASIGWEPRRIRA